MAENPIFGYQKVNIYPGSPTMSVALYKDGTLVCHTGDGKSGNRRSVAFAVTDSCVRKVLRIIRENWEGLCRCAERINGPQGDFAGENHFIFGSLRIVDWDLSRWYVEEDRKKHPEYYQNTVRVELTENYVRAVFDEICLVLEQAEKEIRYANVLYSAL